MQYNLSSLLHTGTSSACQEVACQPTPTVHVWTSDDSDCPDSETLRNGVRRIRQTHSSTAISLFEEQNLYTHEGPKH